jgi:DNA polymerase-3 subunit delta'
MKFSDIHAHENAILRLRDMVDLDRIPHALLLHGPKGIGKMAVARALAQYIHCEHRTNGDSCGVCPSCLQHQSMNHVDTHYIYPVIKTTKLKEPVSADYASEWREFLADSPWMDFDKWIELLGKENAQPIIYVYESAAMIHMLHHTPRKSKYKVVIMWLPEKMNSECANKLLKLIEEPFADTKIIMVSDQPAEILPTIFSRTQRVELLRLSDDVIAEQLITNYAVDPIEARSIAHIADGDMIAGIKALQITKTSRAFLDLFMLLMRRAYQHNVRDLRDWSVKVAELGRTQSCQFLAYCQRLVRENFIYNLQNSSLNYMNRDEAAFSSRFSKFINERNVMPIVHEMNKAQIDITGNGNAKIILFDFAIKITLLLKQ